MAEYEDKNLGVKFNLPDRLTVRQQIAYFETIWMHKVGANDRYEWYWKAALPLITGWECESIPDPSKSLDEMTDPVQARIVLYVGLTTFGHVDRLEAAPKNS